MTNDPTIRIVSDGTPRGTRALDADGKEIPNVMHATVYLDAVEPVHASLDLFVPAVDVRVRDVEHSATCGYCGGTLRHEVESGGAMT